MTKELWGFLLGAMFIIGFMGALNVVVINNQRAEMAALQNQIVAHNAKIWVLNSSLTATNDKLTFLAQKLNPLIGAECRIDQVFNTPKDVPKDYKGHVFVVYDFWHNEDFGLGVICR